MYPTKALTPGTTSNEVKQLQQFLISQGISIPAGATGYYGDQTKAAVTKWQQQNGVQAGADYGYWGPKSIAVASGSSSSSASGDPALRQKAMDYLRNLGYQSPDEQEIQSAMKEVGKQAAPANSPATPANPAPAPTNQSTGLATVTLPNGMKGFTNSSGDFVDQSGSPISNIEIDKYVDDIVAAVVASGKTINPNLTDEDLANLDPAIFLQQAEASIAPEYKEKFQIVKDSLTRDLADIGYDVTKKIEENARITKSNLEQGTEDLAGRGLAFSGAREQFNQDTADAQSRADESARTLAFRDAQSKSSAAEAQIGTQELQGVNLPTIAGRSPFQFSSTPLTGSLNSEKQFLKESMAKELETQERQRKAYATRSLSFS